MNKQVIIRLLLLAGVSLLGGRAAHSQEHPTQVAPAMTLGPCYSSSDL